MDELVRKLADHIEWFIVPTNTTIHGKSQFRAMAKNHSIGKAVYGRLFKPPQ